LNRTQTAFRIREQLDQFTGIVYHHLPKPLCTFLSQMVFALQSPKDIKLSNVAGTLDEPVLLKKTADPLPQSEPREMLPGFC